MWRAAVVMIGLVVLAGCTQLTPANVREGNISETIVLPGKLSTVAVCVTRGFDEKMQTLNSLRVDESAGSAEMIGSDPGLFIYTSTGAVYVVDFKSADTGTQVNYFIRSDVIARETAKQRVRTIIGGCG